FRSEFLVVSRKSILWPIKQKHKFIKESQAAQRNVGALNLHHRKHDSCPMGSHEKSPINTKSQAVKDRAGSIVFKVFISFKANNTEEAVQSLDKNAVGILMQCIYKGFESPSDNGRALLLQWHEKAFVARGAECISPGLTARKTVQFNRVWVSPVGVGVAGTKTKTTKCHHCPWGKACFSQFCLLASHFISVKKETTYQFSFHENWDNINETFQWECFALSKLFR
uniref:Actin-related protein 2/3 complex subunit 5 n=1 Tax=Suricata suricatta TaxID=37032 RepID=A0A673TKJ3_SURSU